MDVGQLDVVADIPVDTLMVSADPSQPPTFLEADKIGQAVNNNISLTTNAMIDYLEKNKVTIFEGEMSIALKEQSENVQKNNQKVEEAQQQVTDTQNAYNQAKESGSPQQIAQAKLNFQNAQSGLYQARIDLKEATSTLMETQITYNNGIIGFEAVPEGQTPEALQQISDGYANQRNELNASVVTEKGYLDQSNANVNQTTNDLNAIIGGTTPAGYENNQTLAIQSAMGYVNEYGEKISEHAGQKAGDIAKRLAANVRGEKIKSYDDAMALFEKIKNQPKLALKQADRDAISAAFNAADVKDLADRFNGLAKTFGLLDKGFTFEKIYENVKTGFATGDWSPLMLQLESMYLSGVAAAFTYSATTSALVGIAAVFGATLPATLTAIVAVSLAGIVAAKTDEDFANELNNSLIPALY